MNINTAFKNFNEYQSWGGYIQVYPVIPNPRTLQVPSKKDNGSTRDLCKGDKDLMLFFLKKFLPAAFECASALPERLSVLWLYSSHTSC